MKKIYSHDNWNQMASLPDDHPEKPRYLRIIGRLASGNLSWFVRRLIGGDSGDEPFWVNEQIKNNAMLPKSDFLRVMRTYEDTLGIN
jgi:hypothetical protein